MMSRSAKVLAIFSAFAFFNVAAANTARTCYTCEGINCQRTTLRTQQKCIDPLDYCVTIFDKFDVVRRGCSSEVPEELRRRCERNTVECHKCMGDRCNTWGQNDFSCLQCDASKDSNCAKNPAMITASRCAVPTAPNSYCYVKQEGGVIKRGCATAVAEQEKCLTDSNCMLCLPGDIKNCNNVDFSVSSRFKRL